MHCKVPLFLLAICVIKIFAQIRKQDDIRYLNVFESSKGNVLVKNESLLGNFTVPDEESCYFQCLQNLNCLSMNVMSLANELVCEIFNWTGTDFTKYLQQKSGARFLQLHTSCLPNPCQNGGQCTIRDGGYNYSCICALTNHYGRNCEYKRCILFDFESGRLDGWSRTGTAFNNQPTYGDNSLARGRETANATGDWWIGGFENRPSPSHSAGATQGDSPQGNLTSPKFEIIGNALTFVIGGGSDTNNARIELLIDGAVVAKAASNAYSETMTPKYFDVLNYRGKTAQFRLVDQSSVGWGHINVDHLKDNCMV